VDVRPAEKQVDDLIAEIRKRPSERVLVTTLTKRMAEDLSEHLHEIGIKVQYLHSDISTLDRVDILYDLRRGAFDVLVGINLLREGIDLPEVTLMAILDADKEGFLRSERSLIQTIGRVARTSTGAYHVRRRYHRLNEVCDRGEQPSACAAARAQRASRDHPADYRQADRGACRASSAGAGSR